MRILHLAHGPFQGLPDQFVALERRFGHQADMVYLEGPATPPGAPEIPQVMMDILPVRKFRAWQVRHRVKEANRRLIAPRPEDLQVRGEPIVQLRPNSLQGLWRAAKDAWMRSRIPGIIRRFKLDGYDVVHFDGARDLTHGAHLAAELKRRGARIVSVFYGTELRVEGVTPALDAISDLSITMEFDHRFLHPGIFFMPAPFEMPGAPRRRPANPRPRIVHAPSHRYNKGTDLILPVMERLKSRFDFEFVLVEGKSQEECRAIKWGCDLCIDQVGNRGGTGYGVSSLEMLAAGIPCVTDFTRPLAEFLADHPFYLADPGSLESVMALILSDPAGLRERGEAGRRWVEKTHGHEAIHARMMEGYAKAGILKAGPRAATG